MTYFGFLLRFIGIPLLILTVLTVWDRRRGRRMPPGLHQAAAWVAVLAHVAAAVIWTTPWDNYLVATGVWYYDPDLVTGVTLGWVPIEEYTFFVVQTLLTGAWLLWLARRQSSVVSRQLSFVSRQSPVGWGQWAGGAGGARPALFSRRNLIAGAAAGGVWLACILPALGGWRPGNYLALQVGWLLPPIILQLLVGAEILWQYRRLVAAGIGAAWLYLSAADAVAIHAGTWTIDPAQTVGILIGGVLPLEESLFFLLTNTLIVFGMTLMLTIGRRQLRNLLKTGNRPTRT
jgi:lycopene cyclase domain-containing protein